MTTRPLLLDLCSGAGGGAVGYHRAGFDVTGSDIAPQPRFPFEFIQADALDILADLAFMRRFAAVHISPPCQRFSAMSACRPGLAEGYQDIVAATRELARATGLPYVIENVPQSPLVDPVWLCGTMFSLELYRHRGFETNWPLVAPAHPAHVLPASKAGHWVPGTVMSVAGHVAPMWKAREVMGGVDWMNRAELGESIPPSYTEYVGTHLLAGC